MFMGNMLFDFILHPAFVVFVLIALFAAVVALVIAHRQKQLSAGFSFQWSYCASYTFCSW